MHKMNLKAIAQSKLTPHDAPYQVTMKNGKTYLCQSIRSIHEDLDITLIASIYNRVSKKPYDLGLLERSKHRR
jgi:hypothetical protein